MKTQTQQTQARLTPQKALELLKEGNKRFTENLKVNRNLIDQVVHTSTGQYPFAFILSCIDSRVPAELIFDLGIGDIFSGRVAGNISNEDLLGSMEFACKVAGSKLILVLGHTRCGAVKGACDHVEMGNLTGLLKKLEPAVKQTQTIGKRDSSNEEFVDNVAKTNVLLTIESIKKQSPVLKEMLDNQEIDIVGGVYNVENGQVEFFYEE
jgi:carbonic anhydrase